MPDTLAPPRPATDALDGIRDLIDLHLVEAEIAAREITRRATAIHAAPLSDLQRDNLARVRDALVLAAGHMTRKLNERAA